jgi:HTH-type transcriptional regulator/antitoxin HipB
MRIRTPKEIGALIRDRRRHMGLDQSTLAKRVGVSRQWIIDAEQGKTRAAVGLILRTLEALDVKLEVHDADDPAKSPTEPLGNARRSGEGGLRGTLSPPPDIDAIVQKARKRRR